MKVDAAEALRTKAAEICFDETFLSVIDLNQVDTCANLSNLRRGGFGVLFERPLLEQLLVSFHNFTPFGRDTVVAFAPPSPPLLSPRTDVPVNTMLRKCYEIVTSLQPLRNK